MAAQRDTTTGKVSRIYPAWDCCYFRLRSTEGPMPKYFVLRKLPPTITPASPPPLPASMPAGYDSTFALLLAAAVNGFAVTVRHQVIQATLTPAEQTALGNQDLPIAYAYADFPENK